jgi:hypothetical protein
MNPNNPFTNFPRHLPNTKNKRTKRKERKLDKNKDFMQESLAIILRECSRNSLKDY